MRDKIVDIIAIVITMMGTLGWIIAGFEIVFLVLFLFGILVLLLNCKEDKDVHKSTKENKEENGVA